VSVERVAVKCRRLNIVQFWYDYRNLHTDQRSHTLQWSIRLSKKWLPYKYSYVYQFLYFVSCFQFVCVRKM